VFTPPDVGSSGSQSSSPSNPQNSNTVPPVPRAAAANELRFSIIVRSETQLLTGVTDSSLLRELHWPLPDVACLGSVQRLRFISFGYEKRLVSAKLVTKTRILVGTANGSERLIATTQTLNGLHKARNILHRLRK
jgi:hypothetical protein